MKIITVVGARPQFIKAAILSKSISTSKLLEEVIIHTGQHYDFEMSQNFFNQLSIPLPSYNLGVGSESHAKQTARMLESIEDILLKENPGIVLLYGDTNSTLAGALAAVKLNIPIAHVEAGLRSFNMTMPEEVNRIVTDRLSTLLFTPTKLATQNLITEGINENNIFEVGDVMYDACIEFSPDNSVISELLKRYDLKPKKYILLTLHRAENTDNYEIMNNILEVLKTISKHSTIVLPIHPRTLKKLTEYGLLDLYHNHAKIIQPVGYIEMLALEKEAELIITDSGGVQKEAYFNKTFCITLRSETEWVELVDEGWNLLASPKNVQDTITAFYMCLKRQGSNANLYGGGNSCKNILEVLENFSRRNYASDERQ